MVGSGPLRRSPLKRVPGGGVALLVALPHPPFPPFWGQGPYLSSPCRVSFGAVVGADGTAGWPPHRGRSRQLVPCGLVSRSEKAWSASTQSLVPGDRLGAEQ